MELVGQSWGAEIGVVRWRDNKHDRTRKLHFQEGQQFCLSQVLQLWHGMASSVRFGANGRLGESGLVANAWRMGGHGA